MEPAEMKKYLVPGLAVAAVIAIGGLLLGLGGPPPETPSAKGSATAEAAGPTCKPGTDSTDTGLSATPPPADAPEWRLVTQGIKAWDVKEGTGDTVPVGHKSKVAMHYTGWLVSNGKQFDSSRGKLYLDMPLERLIPGWQNGIPGMKVGGIRRLYIPAAQGYGRDGSPPSIPPNADLVFEVKLLGFQ